MERTRFLAQRGQKSLELPVDERRLTRARRAVEKAINLLREPDDAGWSDD